MTSSAQKSSGPTLRKQTVRSADFDIVFDINFSFPGRAFSATMPAGIGGIA